MKLELELFSCPSVRQYRVPWTVRIIRVVYFFELDSSGVDKAHDNFGLS